MEFADKMSQSELARRLGDKRPDLVGPWYNNGRLPEGKFMVMLPGILGVDGHWLLTGEGQMERVAPGDETIRLALEVQRLAREIQRVTATAIPASKDPPDLAQRRREANAAQQIAQPGETTTPLGEQRRLPRRARGNVG